MSRLAGGAGGPQRSPLGAEQVQRIARCLAADGVVLLPTDTVYGLACDPESAAAIRRLYEIKGRPPSQPSAVMFCSLPSALDALPELGPRVRAAVEALLPGPVTLLLPNPRRRFPLACSPGLLAGGEDGDRNVPEAALGLRVPALPPALAALASLSRPLMQSSANLSGGAEARRLAEVPAQLRAAVDLSIDGGVLAGVASTIVDLRSHEDDRRWAILRDGPLARAEVERMLGPSPAC